MPNPALLVGIHGGNLLVAVARRRQLHAVVAEDDGKHGQHLNLREAAPEAGARAFAEGYVCAALGVEEGGRRVAARRAAYVFCVARFRFRFRSRSLFRVGRRRMRRESGGFAVRIQMGDARFGGVEEPALWLERVEILFLFGVRGCGWAGRGPVFRVPVGGWCV